MSPPLASFLNDLWTHFADDGRQYILLVMLGFLGSFGFIRLSTRLMRSPRVPWWPGSVVSDSGLHVHHHVFGIIIMMVAGAASFMISENDAPWYGIWGLAFGIGMGLTLDEYALWLHLDDVYWAREGRSSIDATLIALVLMAMALLVAVPVDIDSTTAGELAVSLITFFFLHAIWVLIAVVKGRTTHAIVGAFIPGVAPYAALRLAKPHSMWAKRFYGERRPAKQLRAERRFPPDRRTDRFKERLRDVIGGVTEDEYQAQLALRERGD